MAVEASGFDLIRVTTTDGLSLSVRAYRPAALVPETRLPVFCLPGLSRNARDFHQLARLIASDETNARLVYALDSRGRGNSDWDDDKSHYNLVVETTDVITACAQLGVSRAHFIGTSRGGLILQLMPGFKKELLESVVLNDIGPEIGLEGLRHIQSYLAGGLPPQSMSEAALRLEQIHGAAFPALNDLDWAEMAQAIYAVKDGILSADFDQAIAQAMKDADLSKPGPTLWEQFNGLADIPLLTVRGESSLILTSQTLAEMHQRHPTMNSRVAPGQGHAPLLHHADVYPAIWDFLQTLA